MNAREIGAALLRQRLLFVAVLLLGVAVVAGGLWLAPKSYRATVTISVTKAPEASASLAALDAARRDLAEQARSPQVLSAVQEDLAGERTLEDLTEAVSAAWLEGTALIEVSVNDPDPEFAAEIADEVAAILVERGAASSSVSATVAAPAEVPTTFSSPPLGPVLASGLAAALLLAILVALGRDWRTEILTDGAQVESAAIAPLLAHLDAPHDLTLMPALRTGSAESDLFRHARLAIEAETSVGPSKRVVVAGIGTDELDVWLGANVAIALAHVGRSVVLVDARMGTRFGPPSSAAPDTPGLSDVLQGVDLEAALSPGPIELLSVLPAGTASEAQSEPALDDYFNDVMEELAARFDVVVVLAPALDVADDALTMSASASMLIAVPEGTVAASVLRTHATRVRESRGSVLGVALIGRRPALAA
ncbi:hypothetical protein [Nocardioides sp.]|uniref:hypothetical protein n=1 Tax=Nocardioides sp. TaxID=35761 RepID=UPI003567E7B7